MIYQGAHMQDLKNKVVFINGARSGIGAPLARAFGARIAAFLSGRGCGDRYSHIADV